MLSSSYPRFSVQMRSIQQSKLISLQIKSSRKTEVLDAIRSYASRIIGDIPIDKIGGLIRVFTTPAYFQFAL